MQKKIKTNIKVLEESYSRIYSVMADLDAVVDINGTTLERTYELIKELERIASDIALLKHDLRDDYGDGFRLMNGS